MQRQDMQRLDRPGVVLDLLTGAARPGHDEPGLDLMLADRRGEALKAMIDIDEVPADPDNDERAEIANGLVKVVAHLDGVAGLVLAVRRGGSPEPVDGDFAWYDTFDAACRAHGLTILGVYVATRQGARRVG